MVFCACAEKGNASVPSKSKTASHFRMDASDGKFHESYHASGGGDTHKLHEVERRMSLIGWDLSFNRGLHQPPAGRVDRRWDSIFLSGLCHRAADGVN